MSYFSSVINSITLFPALSAYEVFLIKKEPVSCTSLKQILFLMSNIYLQYFIQDR